MPYPYVVETPAAPPKGLRTEVARDDGSGGRSGDPRRADAEQLPETLEVAVVVQHVQARCAATATVRMRLGEVAEGAQRSR